MIETRDLGLLSYDEALKLQDSLVQQRMDEQVPDTLLLLEHPPVITLGRRGSRSDVYLSDAELQNRGIAVHRATRGGLVTYHGPGQLVGYPIVKLRARGLTVPCYVRALEHGIIAALTRIGIPSRLHEHHIGVWADSGKIAAIGVAQRHGVSLHGFAVNLQPNLAHFNLINPCGIGDLGVTSAAAILGHEIDIADFKRLIAGCLDRALAESSCAT